MNVRVWGYAAVVAAAVFSTHTPADTAAAPITATAPARAFTAPHSTQSGQIGDTLRALDVLHRYGYTVNTPAAANRAIRHWQRVNGLTVDGQVGPQTLASLGMSSNDAATATRPAVRDNLPPVATVADVIRFVWPDDLETRAVAIATRESRLVPTARNACCWGLFQIHWAAHRAWLADIGITAPAQLLDAGTNARAALALFERNGWAPWNL